MNVKKYWKVLTGVHKVFGFSDADGTACRAIQKTAWLYKRPVEKIIFCNGGDRTEDNIPETRVSNLLARSS